MLGLLLENLHTQNYINYNDKTVYTHFPLLLMKNKHCKVFWKYLLNGDGYYFGWDDIMFSKQAARPFLYLDANHEMQSLKWRIGSKIRLKWTVPWFSVFVDQTNRKIIWKFSLSQFRCHKTPIDIENCVKSALNSNHRKQNLTVFTNWGGGDYELRSALAAKQIWVAVITVRGTLDSLPRSTVWNKTLSTW